MVRGDLFTFKASTKSSALSSNGLMLSNVSAMIMSSPSASFDAMAFWFSWQGPWQNWNRRMCLRRSRSEMAVGMIWSWDAVGVDFRRFRPTSVSVTIVWLIKSTFLEEKWCKLRSKRIGYELKNGMRGHTRHSRSGPTSRGCRKCCRKCSPERTMSAELCSRLPLILEYVDNSARDKKQQQRKIRKI